MPLVGQNAVRTKRLNRTLVLESLRRHGPLSRLQIAHRTELTPGTITNLTAELIEEGLIHETGAALEEEQGRPGRRSNLLAISRGARKVLAVHVRPDQASLALIDLLAGIEEQRVVPIASGSDADEVFTRVITVGQSLIERSPVPVAGVGIGAAGMVDVAAGEIVRAPYMGWTAVPLRARFASGLGLPVVLDNNARSMVLAESMFGAAKGADNMVLLFVGRGVGAGLLLEGKRFRGGEVGHTTVIPDGPVCWCGNRGCAEVFASETALLTRFQSVLSKEPDPIGRLLADSTYATALEEAGRHLGIALANTLSLLDVGRVVLAGRLLQAGSPMRATLEETTQERAFLGPGRKLEFLTSALRPEIGLAGAGALALREFIYSA